MNEKPKLKLKRNKIIISLKGKDFELGQKIKFKDAHTKPKEDIIFEGVLDFDTYFDDEQYGTNEHIGFIIKFWVQLPTRKYESIITLIDVFDNIIE